MILGTNSYQSSGYITINSAQDVHVDIFVSTSMIEVNIIENQN